MTYHSFPLKRLLKARNSMPLRGRIVSRRMTVLLLRRRAFRKETGLKSCLTQTATLFPLSASLLCGTANAQGRGGPFGDLEMESHIETMQWLDRRYDQTMRDMERERMEERLQRLESRPFFRESDE